MTSSSQMRRDEGMILIVVLWAVSLMTLAVVAISALSQKSLSLAGAETGRLRSQLALEAGLAVANGLILATPKEKRLFLDGTPAVIDVGDGRMAEIRIRDAAGLLDLNRADMDFAEAAINGLAGDAGNPKPLIEALKLLRPEKKDDKANQPGPQPPKNGNQKQPGQQQDQASEPQPNQQQPGQTAEAAPPPPLEAVSELYGIDGVQAALVDKLLPFITLYSSSGGKVNPMAAPPEILGLVPGLGPRDRDVLAEAQRRRQAETPAVQAVMAKAEKYMSLTEPKTFLVSVKLRGGAGVIAGSRLAASVILDERGKEAFQILDWPW